MSGFLIFFGSGFSQLNPRSRLRLWNSFGPAPKRVPHASLSRESAAEDGAPRPTALQVADERTKRRKAPEEPSLAGKNKAKHDASMRDLRAARLFMNKMI